MNNPIIKFIIRSSLIVVISIALFFVVVDKIKKSVQNIVSQKTNVVLNQKLQENAIKLRADFQKVEPFLDAMQKSFPEGDLIISLISLLEEVAKKTNNQQAFNFESVVPIEVERGLKTVSFSVVLLGNMNTFADYLVQIEKLPLFIKINNISMSGKDGLLNTSRMSLKGTLFVR